MNAPVSVRLRSVRAGDIPIFFEQQLDKDAIRMAAFTSRDPTDRAAFGHHWDRILGNATITARTILLGEQVAGYIVSFDLFGELSVGYWLGRAYWGKGIATAALHEFLDMVTVRPLYARAAKDNTGSLRVLQKCGFIVIGEDKGFAHGRDADVEEMILRLDS